MDYVIGLCREQISMVSLEMALAADSAARLIDSFVEKVIRGNVSFTRSERPVRGRPAYDPMSMLKLYIYGYMNGVTSSRKLERLTEINIEVKWLVGNLNPDFRTIADFRKENHKALVDVFARFREFCNVDLEKATGNDVFSGFKSVDGTKIRAVQSKDGIYTANKIDDRIANDEYRIEEAKRYLEELKAADTAEDSEKQSMTIDMEKAEKALNGYIDRKAKHEKIRKEIEQTGDQYSENDPDARLMKQHYGGYVPSFNVQTAVDSESHMIEAVNVTNNCTDHGLILSTVEKTDRKEDGIVEVVADNGYEQPEDIAACLENGIIPNVCLSVVKDDNGNMLQKTDCEVTYDYEPNEVSEEERQSTRPEDISKCLHAGIVPDCYKDRLEVVTDENGNPEVRKTRSFGTDGSDPLGIDDMSEDERKALAAKGYFVRDIVNGRVYCPAGSILRQKAVKKQGAIRYANKLCCAKCPFRDKCFTECKTRKWKELDFSRNCRIKKADFRTDGVDEEIAEVPKAESKKKLKGKGSKVTFRFRPDRKKLKQRKCLSEHPFGTIKRYMNGDHFMLKGLDKVSAEAHLFALGYNFKRLISIFSTENLLMAMKA